MEMTSTKATLVDTRDFPDSVTATIPRADFEAALTSEEPAELFLEVTQREGDNGEKRDVSVTWSRSDLEQLLGKTSGSTITLAFNRDELERAVVEPDVETHGLREKALVLTVAVATATAGASTAAAVVQDAGGGSARGITPSYVAVHDEATLAARGIEPATTATHDEATLAARGIESAATHDEATLAARGIEPGTLPAAHDEATLVARGIEPGTLPAAHDEATLVARGIEPAAGAHDEATLVARGIEPAAPPASHDEATLTARGIAPATPPPDDGGWAIDVPTPEASTAATVGGLAGLGLLITAAGFAVRRQRGARPA